jgi:hypothetical protein
LSLAEMIELEERDIEVEDDFFLDFFFVNFGQVKIAFEGLELGMRNDVFDEFVEEVLLFLKKSFIFCEDCGK